ncbi:MAG: iron chelate uptake ABC transporter family permease subunit [Bacteroidales bacterium]
MQPISKAKLFFTVTIIAIVILVFLELLLGSVSIPFADVIKFISAGSASNTVNQSILLNFRLPKVITAMLAGSALAVSGLQMQTVFRNPLAGPYVLGISSGASLGVSIVVLSSSALGLSFWLGRIGIVLAALTGSMLILLLILAISVRVRDIMTILILGMMFGSAASAVTSILQYFSDESSLKTYVIWTMGSLSGVSGSQIWLFVGLVLLGHILALSSARPLNVLSLGENYARSLGYRVERVRFMVFLSTSLLAGTTTAFCGPIGFIGIAVPHIVRIAIRTANHAVLIPATFTLGIAVMLVCDLISQLPGYDIVLPVNSVAALMGIPVVVYIIFRNKKISPV